MLSIVKEYPDYADVESHTRLTIVQGTDYYGSGYQDLVTRVPCIDNARNFLGWAPKTSLYEGLKHMIEFYMHDMSS